MVDIYRINRQFERGFLSHQNTNEPPDDRKNSDEVFTYVKTEEINFNSLKEDRVIATINYNPNEKTVRIDRNN